MPNPSYDPKSIELQSLRPQYLKPRLCLLVFIGYATMGAWFPVFSLHLNHLGFTAEETAWALSTNAMGALLAPLIWGQIADRWLANERCIAICALAAAFLLWTLADLTSPLAVILLCVVTWFFLNPIMALSSSFVFRQLEHPERDFGSIRLWGTLGWVAASWGTSLWMNLREWSGEVFQESRGMPDSLRLGAAAALLLVFYALTMPHTPPRPGTTGAPRSFALLRLIDAPVRALHLFQSRSFVVYTGCYFAVYVTVPFAIQLNPLLLCRIGIDTALVPLYATISQSTEVVFLALLPFMLRRFGMKTTMLQGNLVWTFGLIVMSLGAPQWLVLAALTTNGIFICCFVVAGQVFVNHQATPDIRATAQGLLVFISGSALLVGHLLVGLLRNWTNDQFGFPYLAAATVSAISVLVFFLAFSQVSTHALSSRKALVPDTQIS